MSIGSLREIVLTMVQSMYNSSVYFIALSVGLCAAMAAAIVMLTALLVRQTFKK